MLIAIAIGRLYQTLNSAICAAGAPSRSFKAIEVNLTASGTASASAYQIQLHAVPSTRIDPIDRN